MIAAWIPPLYFLYLVKHYIKNLFFILFGLSFAFAAIDYFQHLGKLDIAGNYKILYIFYKWLEALGLLYPLAIVFALVMTKISLIKSHTMGALHAFGYSKKRLLTPFILVAFVTYALFLFLHTTEFSYAKNKASSLLKNELHTYDVNNLFFKYNNTFVYIYALDPIEKKMQDITLFRVEGDQVRATIHASWAYFNGKEWDAKDVIIKTHNYKEGSLHKYTLTYKKSMKTLKGYKPKIIESFYEGKALNMIDAYHTWQLLKKQHVNSEKIRASLYQKVVMPLFSLALLLILFFKLPFDARMTSMGLVIALSLGTIFVLWGILFGLGQIGANGVISPELASIVPIVILWVYAIYVYLRDEKSIV